MVGGDPKFQTHDRAGRGASPGEARYALAHFPQLRLRLGRWRWIAVLSAFVPLSLILVQCSQAPSAGTLAANAQASSGDSFDERFPKPQFKDRFPTSSESLVQLQPSDAPAPGSRSRSGSGP
jgi:hypothetical protein